MVRNESGDIALTYYQNTNKRVKVSGVTYIFLVKRNVNIAWVKPEHVEQILRTRKTCCGGNSNVVFKYSSDQYVRIWNGAER